MDIHLSICTHIFLSIYARTGRYLLNWQQEASARVIFASLQSPITSDAQRLHTIYMDVSNAFACMYTRNSLYMSSGSEERSVYTQRERDFVDVPRRHPSSSLSPQSLSSGHRGIALPLSFYLSFSLSETNNRLEEKKKELSTSPVIDS